MPPYKRKQAHEKKPKKITYKRYCATHLANWPGGKQPTDEDLIVQDDKHKVKRK